MAEDNVVPEDNIKLPEEWEDIDFVDLFSKGWRPRIKKKGDKEYITVRCQWKDDDGGRHDNERSLGPYDPERWETLMKLVPHKSWNPRDTLLSRKQPREKSTKMLTTNIGRHQAIPPSMSIATDILEYYEWFQRKGYSKPLDDWIHECLRNYFIENQMGIGVFLRVGEET